MSTSPPQGALKGATQRLTIGCGVSRLESQSSVSADYRNVYSLLGKKNSTFFSEPIFAIRRQAISWINAELVNAGQFIDKR